MTGPRPPMQMQRHDSATCPDCGSHLWYGTKQEATGWVVYYECGACCFEKRVGWIAMADVDSRGTAERRAEGMDDRV